MVEEELVARIVALTAARSEAIARRESIANLLVEMGELPPPDTYGNVPFSAPVADLRIEAERVISEYGSIKDGLTESEFYSFIVDTERLDSLFLDDDWIGCLERSGLEHTSGGVLTRTGLLHYLRRILAPVRAGLPLGDDDERDCPYSNHWRACAVLRMEWRSWRRLW